MPPNQVGRQLGCIAACTIMLAMTLWSPIYPREQGLQHVPTVVAIPVLIWAARKGWCSDLSMTCLTAMLGLHIVGARWIYSYVPYEQWCDVALGSGPREWFGWTRNHYDRLVHFAYGLLMTVPIVEACQRFLRLSVLMAIAAAWLAVAGISAAYEVFEWALAVIAAREVQWPARRLLGSAEGYGARDGGE